MALTADTNRLMREQRIAELLPQADAGALSGLGLSPRELEELQRRIRGKVVAPGMPEYAKARIGNPVYPHTFAPKLVVYCAVPNDIAVCLEAARRHQWRTTCRSGGHSSAGFSVNNGLVIDVSLMNHVAVDLRRRRANVGAGTTLGELNSVLDTYGLHVPGGTCNDVGVAGHMMGGGYGFTSRQYGLNCDNVVGVKVMLADGTIVEGTPKLNPDLHWAVRGGTGNQFGVLLDVTYELAEVYELWGFCLRWDGADAAQVLAELQSGYMRNGAADALGYLAVFTTFSGKPGLAVVGTYNGPANEGRQQLAALQSIGSASLTIDTTDTYANLNEALLKVLPGIPDPPQGQAVYEAKQASYIARPLGADGWQRVIDFYGSTPNPYNIVVIEPYGGAISRYPVEDSAFVHRAVDMDFFVDSFWVGQPDGPERKPAEEWLAQYLEVVRPWSNGHVYQDYPLRHLADYRSAYWGDAFPSLLAVKQKYDSGNLFDFEQSITPPPAGVTVSSAPARFGVNEIERVGRGRKASSR
jgi:FAD binding domain/Berberine and berberine like